MNPRTIFILLAFGASTALADVDAVATCREAHADDPSAHIECLERALSGRAIDAPDHKLGVEQLRTKRREPDQAQQQMEVRIVSVTYSDEGRGSFQMADGQLWNETERSPRGYRLNPNQEYSARIERGKLGGYRMYVVGTRRMFKVERFK